MDCDCALQSGQVVEAVLMGVDPSTGKVWLSMRQVLPDPLQETLDALLAQGPPADSSEDGGEDEDGDEAMQMPAPEDLSYPREEASMVGLCGDCFEAGVWLGVMFKGNEGFAWCHVRAR